jgi:enoyl-CoA hydratase
MTVRVEARGQATLVTLDRPPVNAMVPDFCEAIAAAFDDLAALAEPPAMVLTGAGQCFSAGVDLRAAVEFDVPRQDRTVRAINRMVRAVYGYPGPVIGAINGHAIAGGAVLAVCCDHRIGPAEGGLFGLTEVQVGVSYPVAAIEVVRAELGPAARRPVLFGRNVGPDEALRLGILDELRPRDMLLERALEAAEQAAALPRAAYGKIKRQLRAPSLALIQAALDGAEPLYGNWIGDDSRAAAAAMLRR